MPVPAGSTLVAQAIYIVYQAGPIIGPRSRHMMMYTDN